MDKRKGEKDRRLLRMEFIIGILSCLPLLISIIIVMLVPMEEWIGSMIVSVSIIPLLILAPFMLRIEQKAGYYECDKCGYRYVPSYKSVFIAPHIFRTRYMKCQQCNKYSWNKKILYSNKND